MLQERRKTHFDRHTNGGPKSISHLHDGVNIGDTYIYRVSAIEIMTDGFSAKGGGGVSKDEEGST